jgi:muramidase (phage lysozyme)
MSDEKIFAAVLGLAAVLLVRSRAAAGGGPDIYAAPQVAQPPRVMNAALNAADAFMSAWAADERTAGATVEPQSDAVPAAIWAGLSGLFGGVESAGDAPGVATDARALLSLIGRAEAPQGYRQIFGGIPSSLYPPAAITEMKVRDVIAWQSSIRSQVRSTAAGRYQMIRDTLREIATQTGNLDRLFNAETQDALAFALLERRGWARYVAGQMSWTTFANNLAKEWAALPVVTGEQAGRSHYAGDGLNKALVTVLDVRAALTGASGAGGVWA